MEGETAKNSADSRADITNIRMVANGAKFDVSLVNLENPNNNFTTPAGSVHSGNAWVPWARSEAEFSKHHIQLIVDPTGAARSYFVWQYGAAIRYSTDGKWRKDAPGVPGDSKSSGDRLVLITGGENIVFANL